MNILMNLNIIKKIHQVNFREVNYLSFYALNKTKKNYANGNIAPHIVRLRIFTKIKVVILF